MNPESEGRYRSRAMRCHACTARARLQTSFGARPTDQGGLFFTVEEPDG